MGFHLVYSIPAAGNDKKKSIFSPAVDVPRKCHDRQEMENTVVFLGTDSCVSENIQRKGQQSCPLHATLDSRDLWPN